MVDISKKDPLRSEKLEFIQTARQLGYCDSVISDICKATTLYGLDRIMQCARENRMYAPCYKSYVSDEKTMF